MVEHWLPLALLAVLAMAFVLVPLRVLRKGESARELHIREEKNRELFAQREQELQQEARDGTIAAEDYQRLLAELQRSFMADMQALQVASATSPRRVIALNWLAPVLALLIPVVAGTIYYMKGSEPDLGLPALLEQVRGAQDPESQKVAVEQLEKTLVQRLARRPKDTQNAYMLGTLYMGMERLDDAAGVFRTMLARMKPDADRAFILGQLARVMYEKEMKKITPEITRVMDEATALNPNQRFVMRIQAEDAAEKGDFVAVLKYLRRELGDLPPGGEEAQQIRQGIAKLESMLPDDQKAAAQGPKLTVVIDVAPELKAKMKADMRLFVYAKNPAMKPPIVAQPLEQFEFPLTVTLDNSMSMVGMTLESAPQLLVGARLSKSGTAIAQSGDFEVESAPFELKDLSGPIKLVINRIVP
jgi:cytochrome c-type biogenesis protein CcmH